jgi:ElaB/YqjD/DUF883 family membrane-anchored ribosome-binding protein
MDRLDQVLTAADPLLTRVDQVLSAAGAPAGHDVWLELRRVRLLPGDAARAVAALHPAAIAEAVPELRAQAQACADTAGALPLATTWSGHAAEAYESARRRTAEQLNQGQDSLSHRMTATAELADGLAAWMIRTRAGLAGTLAGVLTSAEALTLVAGAGFPDPEETRAAAEVATILLRSVGDSYDQAEDLLDDASALTSPQPVG